MRKIGFYLFVVAAFFNIAAASAETSSSAESDILGVWCYIDLDFDNDAVDANGYFIYTIPVPSEGISSLGVQGPGRPYLANNNGTTVDLYINKIRFDVEYGDHDTVPIELFVNRTYNGKPCHYQIMVNVTRQW